MSVNAVETVFNKISSNVIRINREKNEEHGNLRPCGSNIELEKFKRWLIRAVARMLLHEKRNEDEVWIGLKKETGCDFKELWSRMHALTIKKLDRLLQVEDRTDLLPKAARMSSTDWLMFDTVLVHDDFDVIGMKETTAEDKKILIDLFDLVEKHTIEFLAGDDLTAAWLKVTLEYNSNGRQCSPMLLQRRWYQLKLATRARFYKYWSVYKGIVKRQELAEPFKPTPLQAKIAFRYKPLMVKPFMLWEELIKNALVISPEAFEHRENTRAANCDDIDPDAMCIEPAIETIDLNADPNSDEELEYRKTSQSNDQVLITVKQETKDKDEINIDENTPQNRQKKIFHFAEAAMEVTTIALDEIELPDDTASLLYPNPEVETDIPHDDPMANDENDESAVIEDPCKASLSNASEANGGLVDGNETKTSNDCENVECPLVEDVETHDSITDMQKESEPVLPQITSVFGGVDVSSENLSKISLLKALISKFENELKPEIRSETSRPLHDDSDELIIVDDAKMNAGVVSIKDESFTNNNLNCNDNTKSDLTKSWFGDLSNDIDLADDVIQFVDDGIAYVDDESAYQMPEKKTEIKSIIEIEEQDSVLETKKEDEPKVDEKLLMVPVVNMVKLDALGMLPIHLINHINSKSLIDIITAKCKPIKKKVNTRPIKKEINASNPIKREADESESTDDSIGNIKRVKLSNNLLQKPRARTYNPIQVCKNPDFNTRLKKLNVGFFSSARNRILLKACKPLSIDVSKAFERKLVQGTMYLETNDSESLYKDLEPEENNQNVSVVPSAMAVQSLIDNTRGDIPPISYSLIEQKPVQSPPVTSERNRIINLPDISEIRRINQQLLIAEVTPLQAKSGSNQVPESRNIESNRKYMFTTKDKSMIGPLSRTKLMSPQVVDMTKEDNIVKDNSQTKHKQTLQSNADKKQKRLYCCWARERICSIIFSKKQTTKHNCPFALCLCCCKAALVEFIRKKKDVTKPITLTGALPLGFATSELSDVVTEDLTSVEENKETSAVVEEVIPTAETTAKILTTDYPYCKEDEDKADTIESEINIDTVVGGYDSNQEEVTQMNKANAIEDDIGTEMTVITSERPATKVSRNITAINTNTIPIVTPKALIRARAAPQSKNPVKKKPVKQIIHVKYSQVQQGRHLVLTQNLEVVETGIAGDPTNISRIQEKSPRKPMKSLPNSTVANAEMRKTLQSNADKKQKRLYCCWARERICSIIFSKKQTTKHNCPFALCLCCCKAALVEFIRKKKDVGKPITLTGALPSGFATSELSDVVTEDLTSVEENKETSAVVEEVIPTAETTAKILTTDYPYCKEDEDRADTIESEVNIDTVVGGYDANQEEVTQMNKANAIEDDIGAEMTVITSERPATKVSRNITAINTNTIPIVTPKALIRVRAAPQSKNPVKKKPVKQIIHEKYSQVQQGRHLVLTQNLEVVETGIAGDPTNISRIQEKSPRKPMKPLPNSTVANAEMRKTLQSNADKKQKRLYCCWARERICSIIFSKKQTPKHNCPFALCLCCCKAALVEFIRKKKDVGKPITLTGALPSGFATSELSDVVTEDLTSVEENKETSAVVEEVIPTAETTAKILTTDYPYCKEDEDRADTIESEVNIDTVVSGHDSNQEEVTQMNKANAIEDDIGAEVTVITSERPATKVSRNITAINTNIIPIVTPKALIRARAAPQPRDPVKKKPVKQIIHEKYSQVQQGRHLVLTQNLEVVETGIAGDPYNISRIQEKSPRKPMKPLPNSTVANAEMQKTSINQKMIYLNSKQRLELLSDNPIILGKNKILLTTAIFPPNFKAFEAFHNITNTLALPKGIHLLLLPSGRLTYVRDCKIEVSEEFMETLPQLISAIQNQIFFTIAQPIAINSETEVIDLSVDETTDIKENTEQQSDVAVSKDSVDQTKTSNKRHMSSNGLLKAVNDDETKSGHKHTEDTEQIRSGDIPTVNIEETKSVESAVEANILADVNTSESVITPITAKENSGKFKNIMSDLMAMSGIEQSDVTSIPKEDSSQEVTSISNEDLSPVVASTSKEILPPVITVEQVQTSTGEVPDSSQKNDCEEIQPIQHTINPPLLQSINSAIAQNPPVQVVHTSKGEILTSSLTPVTSLSELKYACAQSGLFFKLDLETGLLLPINVCMKKFTEPSQRKTHFVRKLSDMEHNSTNSLEPKPIIDLTDDDVSEVTDITQAILESNVAENQSIEILEENAGYNVQSTAGVYQTNRLI